MLAKKLRQKALAISNENSNIEIDSAIDYIRSLAKTSSDKGLLSFRLELQQLPFSRTILQKTFTKLKEDGFSPRLGTEYYDSEYADQEYFYLNY